MKIKYVMSLALAATLTLLASCSNDNDSLETPKAEMALVKVSFAGGSSESRAFDAGDKGVALSDIKLYYSIGSDIFTPASGGYIPAPDISLPLGVTGTTYSIPVPSNAEKLYVIGNLGVETNYPAASALKTFTKELRDLNSDAIWSYGMTPLSFAAAPGGAQLDGTDINLVAEATVQMELIPARIDVTLVNEMENYATAGALSFSEVAVMYSAEKTLMLSPFGVTPASYVHGLDVWPGMSSATKLSTLSKAWTPTAANVPAEDGKETFYVLPPVGDENLILTAVGTKGSETIYFPVHFNGTDVKHTIESGKSYEVTITFKGDANEGNGGGTIDPEVPVQSAAVTVEITPATWDVVKNIEKEFK